MNRDGQAVKCASKTICSLQCMNTRASHSANDHSRGRRNRNALPSLKFSHNRPEISSARGVLSRTMSDRTETYSSWLALEYGSAVDTDHQNSYCAAIDGSSPDGIDDHSPFGYNLAEDILYRIARIINLSKDSRRGAPLQQLCFRRGGVTSSAGSPAVNTSECRAPQSREWLK